MVRAARIRVRAEIRASWEIRLGPTRPTLRTEPKLGGTDVTEPLKTSPPLLPGSQGCFAAPEGLGVGSSVMTMQ